MDMNDLKIGDLLKLMACMNNKPSADTLDHKMTGKYVIVRCRGAGVHAGYLESTNKTEAVLTNSRRLWYWKPANGQKWLSGVSQYGLDSSSKVGCVLPRAYLTEVCEILETSDQARISIIGVKTDGN